MPKKLVGKYQKYTQSDNVKIKKVFDHKFYSLEEGILDYISFLEKE